MCGVAGLIASEGASVGPLARDVLQAISYRGPDAQTQWTDGRATLLHARLSIFDPAGGGQPMIDTDKRFVIVFNGAIYNYLELRQTYETSGARFSTNSDTEVILEGFKLKGAAVVQDLNGMFAFGIWDRQDRALFLARDRLGKKPLFWTRTPSAFAFASSIDAFRALPDWDRSLSQSGLILYSFLGGLPGEKTAFRAAHAVPAAHAGWYRPDEDRPSFSRYWRPRFETKAKGSEGRFLEEYGALLGDAVRLRLRSDVPLALSFSGGTDSGTIAALAKVNQGIDLPCFTLDHDTPDEPSEEVNLARDVAQRLHLSWKHIPYDYRAELMEGVAGAYAPFDQPCQQLALVYSRRLYDKMHPHCRVVLSGNGADELFTGYLGDEGLIAFDRKRRWLCRLPDFIYRHLPAHRRSMWDHTRLDRLPIAGWARADMMGYARGFTENIATLEECESAIEDLAVEFAEAGVETMTDFVMHRALLVSAADTNYRLPDITGYAAHVEVRSPFLDYRMVEFAARLPHWLKVGRHQGRQRAKYLPRRFYERFVGTDIAWAEKRGLGANLNWGPEFANNPKFRSALDQSYATLHRIGFETGPFDAAYAQYCDAIHRRDSRRPSAGTMMNGFMLGAWLSRAPAAR